MILRSGRRGRGFDSLNPPSFEKFLVVLVWRGGRSAGDGRGSGLGRWDGGREHEAQGKQRADGFCGPCAVCRFDPCRRRNLLFVCLFLSFFSFFVRFRWSGQRSVTAVPIAAIRLPVGSDRNGATLRCAQLTALRCAALRHDEHTERTHGTRRSGTDDRCQPAGSPLVPSRRIAPRSALLCPSLRFG